MIHDGKSFAAAAQARDQLVEEGAPQGVLAAADEAIRHAKAGLTVPGHIALVLLSHASRRMQQNRYGK